MSSVDELRKLYRAFSVVRQDPQLAARISAFMTEDGASLYREPDVNFDSFELDGVTYTVDLFDRFARECYFGISPELSDVRLFRSLCDTSSVVWDVGANFGLYSAACLSLLGPSGQLIAVDPNERVFSLLQKNTDGVGSSASCTLLNCAIAAADGVADFYDAEETAFSGLSDTNRSGVKRTTSVAVRTLDSLFAEYGRRPVDLLKLDVEGFELEAFGGGQELFRASPNVIVQFEVSPKNMSTDKMAALVECLQAMSREGMSIWEHGSSGQLQRVDLESDNPLSSTESNLYMVRGGTEREAQLVAASGTPKLNAKTETENAFIFALQRLSEHHRIELSRAQTKIREQSGAIREQSRAMAEQSRVMSEKLGLILRNEARGSVPRDIFGARRWMQPLALADVVDVAVILRVTETPADLDEVLKQVIDVCESVEFSVIVADARSQAAEPLRVPQGATLIQPAFNAAANRYQQATISALRAASGSHALLLDIPFGLSPGRRLRSLMKLWRNVAASGKRVGAIAFFNADPDTIAELTLGHVPVCRNGLISLVALGAISWLAPGFVGRGIDEHLSLEIWHAGFDIVAAPTALQLSLPDPLHSPEDTDLLRERWRGVFSHPLVPEAFPSN